MNLLFLIKGWNIGGQEVVTSVLADRFIGIGYNVSILFLSKPHGFVFDNLNSNIRVHIFNKEELNINRIIAVRKIIKQDNIDIVINQWGLPFGPAFILKAATLGLKVKIISVYHNQPNVNARIMGVEMDKQNCQSHLRRLMLHVKGKLFFIVTRMSMKFVYMTSDKYVLLSKSHIVDFKSFTGISNVSKLTVITNPVTIKFPSVIPVDKSKQIIYVGRIDYNQKRVFRLADLWKLLEPQLDRWKFDIIGNGEDYKKFNSYVDHLQLRNINLLGFKNPQEYYKTASIIVMVSEFEGLPLILAEAMSYGVVPVVYGSFSSVYDVIDNNINGIIIPKADKFDASMMSNAIKNLIGNKRLLQSMSKAAIAKSRKFNVEPIINKWRKLFNEL